MPLNVFTLSSNNFLEPKLHAYDCKLLGQIQSTEEFVDFAQAKQIALSSIDVLFVELNLSNCDERLSILSGLKREQNFYTVCLLNAGEEELHQRILDADFDAVLVCPFEDISFGVLFQSLNKLKEESDSNSIVVAEEDREFLIPIQDLLDKLPISIFFKDSKGFYLGCNYEFERTHGLRREEIVGKTVMELIPDEYARVSHGADMGLLMNGGGMSYEAVTKFMDGELHDVLISKAVFYDSQGNIAGLVGSIIDITERKIAESKLQNERYLLRTALDLLPDIICVKDLQGRYTLANKKLAELKNVSSVDELIGKTDSAFHNEEVCSQIQQRDDVVLKGECDFVTYENSFYHERQKEQVWLLTSKVPYVDNQGKVIGVVSTSHDISERKKLEDQLIELQGIVNDSNVLVFLLQARSGWPVDYVTNNVSMLGYSPNEFLDGEVTFLDLLHPDDCNEIISNVADKVSQGLSVIQDEYRLNCRDGSELWVESVNTIRRSDAGKVTHYQIILKDIGEKKAIERENEAIQLRLQQSQKLEAVGQLAAGIAHEINTPIQFVGDNVRFFQESWTEISQFISSFQKGSSEDELKEQLEAMDFDFLNEELPQAIEHSLDGINRVASIVLSMKDFSHPGEKNKTAVDINKGLSNTITVSRNEWKYSCDLTTDLDETLPHIFAYESYLNQCFLNIIVNAAQSITEKYEKIKGTGKIHIKTEHDEQYVIVSIQDTGNGIPKEIQDKVFEPFFTTKVVGKGTGQGLALVYDVISRLHGGEIKLESNLGEGSCFRLLIPLEAKDSV